MLRDAVNFLNLSRLDPVGLNRERGKVDQANRHVRVLSAADRPPDGPTALDRRCAAADNHGDNSGECQ